MQVSSNRLDSTPLRGRERFEQRVEIESTHLPCAAGEMQCDVVERCKPIAIYQFELEPVVDTEEERFILVTIQGQRWK